MSPLQTVVGLTEQHIGWRVDAIRSLGLSPRQALQAASPLPAFDQLAEFAADAVRAAPPGRVLVAEHGLGGYATAVGIRGGIDPLVLLSSRVARHARALLPRTSIVIGNAGALPVHRGTLGAVIVGGINDDLPSTLRAARRSLASGGSICVVGLVSGSARDVSVGRLEVRALEWLRAVLVMEGLSDPTWAVGHADVGDWMTIESELAGEIARRRRSGDRYDEWVDHRRLVDRLIGNGDLLVAAVASTVGSPPRS